MATAILAIPATTNFSTASVTLSQLPARAATAPAASSEDSVHLSNSAQQYLQSSQSSQSATATARGAVEQIVAAVAAGDTAALAFLTVI